MFFYFVIFCIIGFGIGYVLKNFKVAIVIIIAITLCWSLIFGAWAFLSFIELIIGYIIADAVKNKSDDVQLSSSTDEKCTQKLNIENNLQQTKISNNDKIFRSINNSNSNITTNATNRFVADELDDEYKFTIELLRTPEQCLSSVKKDGWRLEYVPQVFRTEELCLEAVKQNGWALQFVPEKCKTPLICLAAIQGESGAFEYIPKELRLEIKDLLKSKRSMPAGQPKNSTSKEENKIIREIETRRIKNLIHFTNIKNLESILTHGFIPRLDLENDRVAFEFNDEIRLEGRKDCICFSIEYPNEFFMKKYKHNILCVLQLNIKKVFQNNNGKIYYTKHNAATKMCRDALKYNLNYLSTYDAFIDMFQENNPDTRYQYTRTEKGLKDYLPTNHQAEILITGKVLNNCINVIYFRTAEDLNEFTKIIKNKSLLNKFLFKSDDFYFKSRDNINWEDR